MKSSSVRTAIAVPAALCLALGGVLLAAGPANAAGAALTVPGSNRATAIANSPVPALPPATLTATVTRNTVDQASTAGNTVHGAGFGPSEPIVWTLRARGGTVARPAAPLTPTANPNGTIDATLVLEPGAAGGEYSLTATGQTTGQTAGISYDVLGDPTITGPAQGAKLVGTSVAFTGTGTPGSVIDVFIASSDVFQPLTPADLDALSTGAAQRSMALLLSPRATSPKATSPSAAPADQFTVGLDGRWTGTVVDVPAGGYTFQAIQATLDSDGTVISNEEGDPQLTVSDPAAPVSFRIAAPPVTTTAAGGTGGSSGSGGGTGGGTGTDGQLAFTGSQDTTPAAIAAGILMLLGTALTVVARRRRRPVGD